MKVTIDVQNRAEADAVKAAMDDPETREFVLGCGALLMLPTERGRGRVLAFFQERQANNGHRPAPDKMRLLLEEAAPTPAHSTGE